MTKNVLANTKDEGGSAAIYVRTACQGQAGQPDLLAMQRAVCRRQAEQLGAEVVHEFADAGVSGNRTDRPGLQRLLAYITEQPVSYLIVQDHARLSRRLADHVALTGAIEQAGVTLVVVDGSGQLDPAITLCLTEATQ